MRILLGTESLKPPLTGIGYYTFHLISELAKMPEIELAGINQDGVLDRDALLALLQRVGAFSGRGTTGSAEVKWSRLRDFAREVPGAYFLKKQVNHWKVKKLLQPFAVDALYHEPNFISAPFKGRSVITVHDLSHLRYPETHPRARVSYLNAYLPGCISRASRVITDSFFIKRELLQTGLVADESRIGVTHLGYDAGFHPRSEEEVRGCLEHIGIGWKRFILAVATLEPRKNTANLVRAYLRLPHHIACEFPLVLTGSAGWRNAELFQLISQAKLPYRIISTGYLPRIDVQCLMSAAAVFAYPSLYEGFGLPVLEAMASNTAVLTSNTSSLDEISGEAAFKVAPKNLDDIIHGLTVLLDDEGARAEYARLGSVRATQFSWEKCALQTCEVYRQALTDT